MSAAHKELAYLEQFGQPLLPFQRMRRAHYHYQEQSPSDHVENLNRYLSIAPSISPRDSDPALCQFCIRHADLQPSNIVVSKSSDSGWHVVSLLDWQHTPILPLFLIAGIPQRLQNYGDLISELLIPPSLPGNLGDLDESEQNRQKELYRDRLVHYHYMKSTEEFNKVHHMALTSPLGTLRRRLFDYTGEPWEGETIALKLALIEATENWNRITGGGAPCPVAYDAEDVQETKKLDKVLSEADKTMDACNNMIGLGGEGWVPTEHYEAAASLCKQLKENAFAAAESAEERAEIEGHWPFDDMDEEKYM